MKTIKSIIQESINKVLFEGLQSWKYNKEVDDIVADFSKRIKKGNKIEQVYLVDDFPIRIEYPSEEFDAYTEPTGEIYIFCDAPFDPYDLKTTLFHELEHACNTITLTKEKPWGTQYRLGTSFQDKLPNNYVDKVYTDTVDDVLYRLWDRDERDAQLADYVQSNDKIHQLELDLSIIKKTAEPLFRKGDENNENFWLMVGGKMFDKKKGNFRKGKRAKDKSHNGQFYYNYFMKKSWYLLKVTKNRYMRNILKSPQQSLWAVQK